jgi:hypothetical protein
MFKKPKTTKDRLITSSAPDTATTPAPSLSNLVLTTVNNVLEAQNNDASQFQDPARIEQTKGKARVIKMAFTEEVEKFEAYIAAFEKNNQEIEQQLKSWIPPTVGYGLPSAESVSKEAIFTKSAQTVQEALDRLHRSIRFVNTDGRLFSLKIETDFAKSSTSFASKHDYVGLRSLDEYFYFGFQQQTSSTSAEAREFVIETKKVSKPKGDKSVLITELKANKLEQAPKFVGKETVGNFINWGGIIYDHADWKHDIHKLFRCKLPPTRQVASLRDLISDTARAPKLCIWQRLKLAKMATSSMLYLLRVRRSCQAVSTASFAYFSAAGLWDDLVSRDPTMLKPYLSIGFGQRHDDLPDDYDDGLLHPIAEFGTILFEIFRCVAIGMDPQASAPAVPGWADKQHSFLVKRGLEAFADIARDCVRYVPDTVADVENNMANEGKFLVDKWMRLGDLERKYSMRTDAGLAVVDP